jgi:hypothetical protein
MSLSSALADLYETFGYATSPASAVTTRLTRLLNKAQQDVLAEIGGARLARGSWQFDSVADQTVYALPPTVSRVLSLRDIANQITLRPIPEATYRAWVPDPGAATGTPTAYSLLGLGFVATRTTTDDTIQVASSSAGDTTQTAYIEYTSTAGAVKTASVTLTGTTLATLATDVYEVTDAYL